MKIDAANEIDMYNVIFLFPSRHGNAVKLLFVFEDPDVNPVALLFHVEYRNKIPKRMSSFDLDDYFNLSEFPIFIFIISKVTGPLRGSGQTKDGSNGNT